MANQEVGEVNTVQGLRIFVGIVLIAVSVTVFALYGLFAVSGCSVLKR